MHAFAFGTGCDDDIDPRFIGLGHYIYVCRGVSAFEFTVLSDVVSTCGNVMQVGNFF